MIMIELWFITCFCPDYFGLAKYVTDGVISMLIPPSSPTYLMPQILIYLDFYDIDLTGS